MRLLHWVLAPPSSFSGKLPEEWGQPPAVPEGFGTGIVSVLYSDVGSEFYKAAGPLPGEDGWGAAPHIITTWNLASAAVDTTDDGELQWRWLVQGQLKECWERDSELIIKETLPTLSSNTKQAFTFLPRKGLGEHLYRRTDWFVRKMEHPPKYWGMEATSGEENSSRPFVSWSFEMYPSHPRTLLITRLRCPRHSLAGMMSALFEYARALGIDKILAWNLPEELKEEATKIGGESAPADSHLASVKWYGEGASSVEWLNSEK